MENVRVNQIEQGIQHLVAADDSGSVTRCKLRIGNSKEFSFHGSAGQYSFRCRLFASSGAIGRLTDKLHSSNFLVQKN